MKANGAIAILPAGAAAPATPPQPAPLPPLAIDIELLKEAVGIPGATDAELKIFALTCARTRLDPFKREIYMVKRWNKDLQREVLTHMVAIDGFRTIAERTHNYLGQTAPEWCGPDGKWLDVWLDEKRPPAAARVGVLRADFTNPIYAVALYREYVQTTKDGQPVSMWRKMPANQLLKCSEALALRKAFPNDLSGLYTADEMGQAENPDTPNNTRDMVPTKKTAKSYSEIPEVMPESKTVSQPEKEMGIPDIVRNLQPFKQSLGEGYDYRILRDIGGAEHSNKVPLTKARQCWKFFESCLRVREFSERIGSDEYKRILRDHGYETAQQIPTLEEFAAILRIMRAAEAAQGAAK